MQNYVTIDGTTTGATKDSEIEAIRHIYLFWEGWMWHPEREEISTNQNIQLLRNLFSE